MKNKYIFFSAIIFTTNILLAQTVITAKKTFKIQAATVVNGGYPYNLNTSASTLAYIRNVILKDPEVLNNAEFSGFITDSLETSAIIFLRHGLNGPALLLDKDPKALLKNDLLLKKLNTQADSIKQANKIIDSLIFVIKYKNEISEKEYDHIISTLGEENKMKNFLSTEKISILKNPKIKLLLIEEMEERKIDLIKKLKILDDKNIKNTPSFEESKDIVQTILHKKYDRFTDYLLSTKKIMIVILGGDNDLQNAEITIKNKINYFKQSFEDLLSTIPKLKGITSELTCKVIILNTKMINPPSELSIKPDSAKAIVFTIHEKNVASFQIGVINNRLNLNNFSISGGNLVVKPDVNQKTNWKSNLFALLELHLPRDIDNFRPIYKTIFKGVDSKRTFSNWLDDVILARIGIYGGFKISDDPLSTLHTGLNFAISKELYINFGWTWSNQIQPQVTPIGSINSLQDAVKHAKRKYGDNQFSWGLSFAPSALISSFGITKKAAD